MTGYTLASTPARAGAQDGPVRAWAPAFAGLEEMPFFSTSSADARR